MAFDLMPLETEHDWSVVSARIGEVPQALANIRSGLLTAADAGRVAALRQVAKVAEQCETWAGLKDETGFFTQLAGGSASQGDALKADLAQGVRAAEEAFAEFAGFLRAELAPKAPVKDAVGEDVYRLWSRLLRRRGAGPARGVRVGLGRVRAHRVRDARRRQPDQGRRFAGGGRGGAGRRPPLPRPGPRRVRGVDAAPVRRSAEVVARQALRHLRPRDGPGVQDRPAGRRRRRVLHGPERGLRPPGPDVVVPAVRPRRVRHVARNEHGVPRGSTGPPPPDRDGGRPVRGAQQVPAPDGVHLGPRGGLGAVRGAPDGGTGLPVRRRRPAGHAVGAAVPRRSGGRRPGHAPRAGDSRRTRASTRVRAGRRSWAWSSC